MKITKLVFNNHKTRREKPSRRHSLTLCGGLRSFRDMSRAIILQHSAYGSPGRIVPVLRDFGIPTEIRRLDKGDEMPTDLDEVPLLVVLGGPMHVADVGSEMY